MDTLSIEKLLIQKKSDLLEHKAQIKAVIEKDFKCYILMAYDLKGRELYSYGFHDTENGTYARLPWKCPLIMSMGLIQQIESVWVPHPKYPKGTFTTKRLNAIDFLLERIEKIAIEIHCLEKLTK